MRDEQAMRAFLLAVDDADPTECVIASAGVTMVTPRAGMVEDLTRCRDLFDVNLNGVMNTLAPLAPRMRAAAGGRSRCSARSPLSRPRPTRRPMRRARRPSSPSRSRPARSTTPKACR